MRDSLAPLASDDYHRPQQAWHCGLADEGPPCPLGPEAGGGCPAAAACRPLRDGDRWRCNRSPLRGGPCAIGPDPEGRCAIVYRCTPVRSLRSRRGRIVGAAAAAAVGAACMMLSGPWRNEWIAAGPLSRPHANLVAGDQGRQGCAACHAAGAATLAEWWASTTGGADSPTQTALCVQCHGSKQPVERATAAHNMAWPAGRDLPGGGQTDLAASDADGSRRRDPAQPIACAACHREHQGVDHSLTAMSNSDCQACHRERMESFSTNHPEFGAWPYGEPTRIAFDHASHRHQHFPEQQREFRCAECHAADPAGDVQLTAAYETACAGCHDKSLQASLGAGLLFVALPTLDVEALARAGRDLGPWPAQATGDFEGSLPAAMQLLLAADEQAAAALTALGPRFDFFDLDLEDNEQAAAASDVIAGTKALLGELAERGPAAIGDRLSTLLGRQIDAAEVQALAANLSPSMLRAFRDRWLPADQAAASGGANQPAPHRPGGWVLDDLSPALRYDPSGHADRWLTAWLDVLAEAADGSRRQIAQPLLAEAIKPSAPGQCGSCHTLNRAASAGLAMGWRTAAGRDQRHGLTRFAHGPHLLLPTLGECSACHQVAAPTQEAGATTLQIAEASATTRREFEPLHKDLCATCHTAGAAGDNCLQCHRYHGGDWLAGGNAMTAGKRLSP